MKLSPKHLWKCWRATRLSSTAVQAMTFYPQHRQKPLAAIRRELFALCVSNKAGYSIDSTISQYFQHGVDRAGEKCADYLFQKEFDRLRDQHLTPLAFMLDSKWITNKYLTACGIRTSNALTISKRNTQRLYSALDATQAREFFAKPEVGIQGKNSFPFSISNGMFLYRGEQRTEAEMLPLLQNHIIEEKIVQHPSLDTLYPHAVSSIRLVTVLRNEHVEIFSKFILLGSGGACVSNGPAGGIAVGIDDSGKLCSLGHRNVAPHGKYAAHPDTGIAFKGLQLPFWEECLALVQAAHLCLPSIYSIGWDIAITPSGPIIIEANRDWGTALDGSIYGPSRTRAEHYFAS